MGLLGPSFQIGRSALAAYQAAISVVGQNIANVGNPNYTRQSGRLTPLLGGPTIGGPSPGAGVRMSALNRHIDEAVETRLRSAFGSRSNATAVQRALSQVETLFNELTQQDVSTQLSDLFNSFSALQTTPDEITNRNLVLSAADTLMRSLHRQRAELVQLASDLNESVINATRRASAIATEIAELNQAVVVEEAQSQGASGPLRDRRDMLLRELSGLLDIRTRPQENGSVNIFVGGEPLVEFNRSRGLSVDTVLEDGIERATVRFSDNNGTVIIRDGELAGIRQARDQNVAEMVQRLDRLANALIYEVNRVHSAGRGLVGYTNLVGTYDVDDVNAALNSPEAGLPFPVENGVFIVHVTDTETGRTTTTQIEVDLDGLNGDDTSLADLAAALDGVAGLSASVTTDNRLRIDVAAGSELGFSEDSSGALAALGVATFFQGQDASDIDIHSSVRADSRLIAASLTGEIGDGQNAGLIASINAGVSDLLDHLSIQDFHATTINTLAVDAAAARSAEEAADAVHGSLVAQREAISGVSLDEEAINLAKFEKAFQGASRFLGVINRLADEMLALVR